MTIKEKAKQYQVSTQAIYQRLKKKNIHIESLTDKATGELTPEGELVIDKLYDKENQPYKANSRAYADEQESRIKQLNIDNAIQLEKIDLLEKRIEYLQAQLDKETQNVKDLVDLQKQTLNRLLPEGQPTDDKPVVEAPRRLTWRERITGKRNR